MGSAEVYGKDCIRNAPRVVRIQGHAFWLDQLSFTLSEANSKRLDGSKVVLTLCLLTLMVFSSSSEEHVHYLPACPGMNYHC